LLMNSDPRCQNSFALNQPSQYSCVPYFNRPSFLFLIVSLSVPVRPETLREISRRRRPFFVGRYFALLSRRAPRVFPPCSRKMSTSDAQFPLLPRIPPSLFPSLVAHVPSFADSPIPASAPSFKEIGRALVSVLTSFFKAFSRTRNLFRLVSFHPRRQPLLRPPPQCDDA